MKPVLLSVSLAITAVAVCLILIEFFSPAARLFNPELKLDFKTGPDVHLTLEQRVEIRRREAEIDEQIRRGEIEPERRRLRIYGPFYALALPLLVIGFLAKEWRVFLAIFVPCMLAFSAFGFFFLIEIGITTLAFFAGFWIKRFLPD